MQRLYIDLDKYMQKMILKFVTVLDYFAVYTFNIIISLYLNNFPRNLLTMFIINN